MNYGSYILSSLGKTTIADCLIASNGIISARLAGKVSVQILFYVFTFWYMFASTEVTASQLYVGDFIIISMKTHTHKANEHFYS